MYHPGVWDFQHYQELPHYPTALASSDKGMGEGERTWKHEKEGR